VLSCVVERCSAVSPGWEYLRRVRRVAKGKPVATAEGTFTVNGKAANGQGLIYRERDGTWRATYRVPGVARPRKVRGRTREETLRRRDDALADALATAAAPTPAGSALSRATTVGEFARWWLRNVAANRVRASSLGKYNDRVERITARLGDIELGALRAEQVGHVADRAVGHVVGGGG
jgi:hypothetical protein